MAEHFDVLIIGSGISGIGAAVHLQRRCPEHTFAILESRDSLGGTWDLFRYPGVRSDSDMHTLGFSFKPWRGQDAIAAGPAILEYLHETVREFGLHERIRFGQRVKSASWDSATARWTLELELPAATQPASSQPTSAPSAGVQRAQLTCSFLLSCTGYYRYDKGHCPELPGRADFAGKIVHPQHWPLGEHLQGQRVVVIGSGATAMSLVPALAKSTAHVTLLQRSPTYVASVSSRDPFASRSLRWLPSRVLGALARWANIFLLILLYQFCRSFPQRARRLLIGRAKRRLPPGYDVQTHFTPHYDPWEERLCVLIRNDLFKAIRDGRVEVVTDSIERLSRAGVIVRSGRELPADTIVTATGLELQRMGGISLTVDGAPVDPGQCLTYRGIMHSDIPNMAACFGYANASWTLKSELGAKYVCRLLNYMQRKGHEVCWPRAPEQQAPTRPFVTLASGYIKRGQHEFPRQGDKSPWTANQNYLRDLLEFGLSRMTDGSLEFRPDKSPPA